MAGRPRSAQAHRSVLDAAVTLFAERGIDGTSMDAIAGRSGVSKATIYKHWPNKDALALEILDHLHRLDDWPDTQSPDVMADITEILDRRPSPRTAAVRAKIMPWRARLLEPTRQRLTRLLRRAIAEGRLPLGFDCNVGVALLLGPMLYRWMASMVGVSLPDNLPSRVVDGFQRAYAVSAPAPHRHGRRRR